MQAALTNTIKLVKTSVETRKFPSEVILYLLKASENADTKTRSEIENHLVKIGEDGIPILVNRLKTSTSSIKALISMVLIRLGRPSIKYLKAEFNNDARFEWVVDYIINEIEGSGIPLDYMFEYNGFKEILAC